MDSKRPPPPDPAEIRRCLFIRALEEADPAGERMGLTDRVAASKAAAGLNGWDFIRARAEVLGARLKGPLVGAYAGISKSGQEFPWWLGPLVGGSAFLLGWITHDLGKEGRVSLLAFPLLGLILWNLAVVIVSLAGLRRPAKALDLPALPAWLQPPEPISGDDFTDSIVSRTTKEWRQAGTMVWLARLKLLFHVAALLLAAGVVAGMYARGLVKNYQAGWESTFLTQPMVAKLTGIVLGPASILTGVAIPTVPPQGGLSPAAPWIHPESVTATTSAKGGLSPAAPWIHLWAATAGLLFCSRACC